MANNKVTRINDALTLIRDNKASLTSNNVNLLHALILFGEQLSQLEQEIPSTKLRGQAIAERFPASRDMDTALRSNCKWLYEALNKPKHPAGDILQVFGLQCIEGICARSGNPTVIRRLYGEAKRGVTALAA